MRIIKIAALSNGAHNNQAIFGTLETIPEGWAIIPDDMEIPNTFPFVDIEVEDLTYYRDVEVLRDVTKTREVVATNEDGEEVTTTEEYTEPDWVTEQEPYTVPTVVSMTAGVVPESEPEPAPAPTQLDIIEAQVTYTALMTDTLLEV